MRVKVCGITNLEDAYLAATLGADALGFIFYEKSPRFIQLEAARQIVQFLPPFVTPVGVFVDASVDEVRHAVEYVGLQAVQQHAEFLTLKHRDLKVKVIAAIQVKTNEDLREFETLPLPVSAVVLDTKKDGLFGGTGQAFDWDIAIEAKKRLCPIVLSGGLNSDTIVQAITHVRPYAVDVSSGLEARPGKKDPEKMMDFFDQVRSL